MDDEKVAYELGYLMLPTVGVGDVSEKVSEIIGEITSRDGEVLSSNSPEVIFLEYDMSKVVGNKNLTFSSAYFGWMRFKISPSKVREVRDAVDSNKVILRSLLIKLPKEALLERPSRVKVAQQVKKDDEGGNNDEDADVATSENVDNNADEGDKSEE